MDVEKDKDKDLLYIAREGLKAPLPDPWKPCQTREKEIYYFNFETGESTWDHPCDEYYRKMYEREKEKRNRQQAQAQQMTSNAIPYELKQLGASSKPIMISIILIRLSAGSKKQAKMPPLKLDEISKQNNTTKKVEPMILGANDNKKIQQYREQREKEIQKEIQALQEKFEKKKKDLEREHQKKLKDVDLDYDKKQAEMEDRVREENKPYDNSEISTERNKREADLRNEAEKAMAHRIKLLQQELTLKLEDSKEKYNKTKAQKQKEITDEIAMSYASEMQMIENELFKLKVQQSASNLEDLESYEHNAKKSFSNEQEMKFQFDKETLLRNFREKTAELKDIALQRQREEISRLHKKFESENLKQDVRVISWQFFSLIL